MGVLYLFSMAIDEFVKTKVLSSIVLTYGIVNFKSKNSLAVINPTKKRLMFAFSKGVEFEDRYGLLEDAGKVSKNARVKSLDDADEETPEHQSRQAMKIDYKKVSLPSPITWTNCLEGNMLTEIPLELLPLCFTSGFLELLGNSLDYLFL